MKKRIKLKKNINYDIKLKNKIILIIILILLCSLSYLYYLDKTTKTTMLEYAKNETTLLSTFVLNEAIEENLILFDNIEDYIIETKNKNDEIVSVDFNVINVNRNLTSINSSILKNLKKIEKGELSSSGLIDNLEYTKNNGNIVYYIPAGIITNNLFLTSIGYKIPLKMNAMGNVVSKIKTNLEEYGINNILFKMYIDVEITQLVLLPFVSEKIMVKVEIPIITKIIEGKIPSVYGGILTNTSSLNTLNVE